MGTIAISFLLSGLYVVTFARDLLVWCKRYQRETLRLSVVSFQTFWTVCRNLRDVLFFCRDPLSGSAELSVGTLWNLCRDFWEFYLFYRDPLSEPSRPSVGAFRSVHFLLVLLGLSGETFGTLCRALRESGSPGIFVGIFVTSYFLWGLL